MDNLTPMHISAVRETVSNSPTKKSYKKIFISSKLLVRTIEAIELCAILGCCFFWGGGRLEKLGKLKNLAFEFKI